MVVRLHLGTNYASDLKSGYGCWLELRRRMADFLSCHRARGARISRSDMASIFGEVFRIATWGESHGGGVGVVIDGCPPRLALSEEDIQPDLDRRRPGQSDIVTPRKEEDTCHILSGVFEGATLGTPISILVRNTDARPEAYKEMETTFRPSHATSPIRRNMASAIGRVAVAPRRGRRLGGSRRAPWPRSC